MRHRSRSPCYCHLENPPHVSAANRLPHTHTIRHPAIGSCISRSRHPWGRAACPCELWPVSVSALPSGLATPSARPAHGHSDTPLPQDRSCSSGTCQHKKHSQEGTPGTGVWAQVWDTWSGPIETCCELSFLRVSLFSYKPMCRWERHQGWEKNRAAKKSSGYKGI